MSGEMIASSATEASKESALVTQDLREYCSLNFGKLSSSDPVPGSSTHDTLGSDLESALQSWQNLLKSEAHAIISVSERFDEADKALALQFMGMGW